MLDEEGRYEGMVFDVDAPLEYFVEADGVRSATFTLTVIDAPYVERVELEYHFPAYTGLEPQTIQDGGDIAVLQGTEVRLRVFSTMTTPGGRLALNEDESATLTAQADGSLTAVFTADRDGFYRIELDAPTGERTAASPQYTIDVLTDQPPSVSFAKPGRDTSASSIEEVYVEAQAEDDFGDSQSRVGVLGQRWARGDRDAVRRRHPPAGSHGRPHVLHRGTRRRARRLGVVLRPRARQCRGTEPACLERLVFPAYPSVQSRFPPGAIAGWWRWRWRRRAGRSAVGTAARNHLRHVQRSA